MTGSFPAVQQQRWLSAVTHRSPAAVQAQGVTCLDRYTCPHSHVSSLTCVLTHRCSRSRVFSVTRGLVEGGGAAPSRRPFNLAPVPRSQPRGRPKSCPLGPVRPLSPSCTLETQGRAWPDAAGLSSLNLSVWKIPQKTPAPNNLLRGLCRRTCPRCHFSAEMTGKTTLQMSA